MQFKQKLLQIGSFHYIGHPPVKLQDDLRTFIAILRQLAKLLKPRRITQAF